MIGNFGKIIEYLPDFQIILNMGYDYNPDRIVIIRHLEELYPFRYAIFYKGFMMIAGTKEPLYYKKEDCQETDSLQE